MTCLLTLVDGSAYTPSVCDHAAWAAKRLSLPVELVHALGHREEPAARPDFTGSLDADAQDRLLVELTELDAQKAKLEHQRGRLVLDSAKARLEQAGVAHVAPRLRNGDVLEAIQDLGSKAALIVIGKRGEAADFATLHLGSNLERVVRATSRPVLVASRAFQPVTRFVIAFDGGPSAIKAVEEIARGPLLRDLPGRLLMAGTPAPAARDRLDQAMERLLGAGFAVEAGVEAKPPEEAIAQAMDHDAAGLLIMGAYGHSRIRSLIIGSTTTAMIRSVKAPVLLFR